MEREWFVTIRLMQVGIGVVVAVTLMALLAVTARLARDASEPAVRRLLDRTRAAGPVARGPVQPATQAAVHDAAASAESGTEHQPATAEWLDRLLGRPFAQPWERRLVDEAHRLGLPYALHVCGRTDRILDDMLATGADALELDYKTDARVARDRLKGRAAFIGNLDPSGVLALGRPALVAAQTRELVAAFADAPGFILNAGCAIPATTPPENLRAMIRAAR